MPAWKTIGRGRRLSTAGHGFNGATLMHGVEDAASGMRDVCAMRRFNGATLMHSVEDRDGVHDRCDR